MSKSKSPRSQRTVESADLEASQGFVGESLSGVVFGRNPVNPAAYATDDHGKLIPWQLRGFHRHAHIGHNHTAQKVPDETVFHALLEWVVARPGDVAQFNPEPLGQGPKVHVMMRKSGGTHLEFIHDPR